MAAVITNSNFIFLDSFLIHFLKQFHILSLHIKFAYDMLCKLSVGFLYK